MGKSCAYQRTDRSCGRYVRLAICSLGLAIALALSGMTAPAAAQDACKKLDDDLVARGKALPVAKAQGATTAPETPGATGTQQTPDDAALRQKALDDLAGKPSPLLAKVSDRLATPGQASVTFEDKKIEGLDAGKICVRAFAKADKEGSTWESVPVRQVFLTEKSGDTPKRLNVIFDVEESAAGKTRYLFVGAQADGAPTIFLNHSARVVVTNKCYAALIALLFVLAFYLALAWITYNDETRRLTGPAWLAYTLSPVRISAAWFGEASMSQVQLLLFTFIVAGLLFYHWWSARVLSDLSMNLLMLIGISAVGTGASKFAQTVKTSLNDQTARYLIGKGWYSWELIPARSHATLSKLLLTDGRLDIYKFQMAIFTVVVACYVISAGYTSLVDVKISETMLYLIGISQGVYVGGKAVTDRTTDLEASVQKMIELEDKIRTANAADRQALYDQYAAAARIAAIEFTALQNRKFPTKYDAAKQSLTSLGPQASALKTKAGGGATLTADEEAVVQAFDQADMTAKEFAAYAEPAKTLAVQDPKNIDPAVLKP